MNSLSPSLTMKTAFTTAHGDIRALPQEAPPPINFHGVRILAMAAYVLLNLLYILACMQRTAIPGAIFDNLQGDLGLLGSQVTGLGSAYVYCYATSQIFAGMLVDRFGGKNMGMLGGILMGIGLVQFSMAHSPATLYASRAITAFGQAFIYLCVVKISHLLFPPRQFGALVGISMAIGFGGGILGTLPTQYIAQVAGWRPLFMTVGACCIVSVVAMFFALGSLHERRRKSGSVSWHSFAHLFNNRGRLCFTVYDFWVFPSFFVLQSILGQKFIQDWLGYPATTSARFTMLLTFFSILTCTFGAPLMRLTGQRRMPIMLFAKGLPVLTALVMMAGIIWRLPAWIFLFCFVLMSVNQLASASSSALMSELTDTKTIAFTAAVRNFFPYVGCGIVGGICGSILDRFAPAEGAVNGIIHYPPEAYIRILGVMMVFGIIGFIFLLQVPETHGKHIYADPEQK